MPRYFIYEDTIPKYTPTAKSYSCRDITNKYINKYNNLKEICNWSSSPRLRNTLSNFRGGKHLAL